VGETVKLRHGIVNKGKKLFAFYDGLLVARDGVIEVPAERFDWIRRAWVAGYALTPEGDRLFTVIDLKREVERQTAKSEVDSEDSGSRGQPKAKDRVRSSKLHGDSGHEEGGTRSSGSRGAAEVAA
jgi:hypothetical protein